jgi:beta-galactosidase
MTCSRALVDNDRWMLDSYLASGLSQISYHPEPFEILSNGVKIVTRITGLKSAMFVHEAKYLFSDDGSVVVENKVLPFGTMPKSLPRIGLSMRLSPTLETMRYYGRGPWENYVDRNASTFVGIWDSTVKDQFVNYARPQDNGYKTDVRWAEFFEKGSGRGVKFEADIPLFMQALHYEENDLASVRHIRGEKRKCFELEESHEIFLKLDARQTGLGGNSCGPIPLKEYIINPNEKVEWTLKISPL